MRPWPIEFYKDEKGAEPVKSWMDGLSEEIQARVTARIGLLAEHGPTLDYPYTSQIEGRLREARLRFGKTRYRVLYFFDDDRAVVLLHAFTKDTDAVEESDKKIGRARLKAHTDRKAQRKKVG
ncbi:MAG: type II toxin-antitoxin system RelE/ParE family toxin [Acidobacteriaceae bacterium]|nr:type II toxin-antitoxin system RelE/ParE family toxin [Acidobacteriaceae bacterium]